MKFLNNWLAKSDPTITVLTGFLVLLSAAWLFLFALMRWKVDEINSYFTALTFGGLIMTIILQSVQGNKQQKQYLRENFQNNIFNLFNLHNEIVKNIIVGNKNNYVGKEYLKDFYNSLPNAIGYLKPDDFEGCRKAYLKNYDTFKPVLDPYFMSIHNLLFFINSGQLTPFEIRFFLVTFDTQLLYQEKVILYYHALFSGNQRLLRLYKDSDFHTRIVPHNFVREAHGKFIMGMKPKRDVKK